MRYIGREEAEALFRGAVQRAAEKYAEEAVCEAQNMRKADRRSDVYKRQDKIIHKNYAYRPVGNRRHSLIMDERCRRMLRINIDGHGLI